MQTFLPYPDFAQSAAVLDSKRLGKQRVEAMQILKALVDKNYGWQNHPATKMWRGSESSLCWYAKAICEEWEKRGFRDTVQEKISEIIKRYQFMHSPAPRWLGDPGFHASHRSNLLRKDPVHYGQFGWNEPDDLPYIWPEPS